MSGCQSCRTQSRGNPTNHIHCSYKFLVLRRVKRKVQKEEVQRKKQEEKEKVLRMREKLSQIRKEKNVKGSSERVEKRRLGRLPEMQQQIQQQQRPQQQQQVSYFDSDFTCLDSEEPTVVIDTGMFSVKVRQPLR